MKKWANVTHFLFVLVPYKLQFTFISKISPRVCLFVVIGKFVFRELPLKGKKTTNMNIL